MSLRFQNPSSFIIAGPSGVGKTFWIFRFVDSLKEFCPEVERVVYHYEIWQELFDKHANKIDFKQGVPNLEDLKEYRNAFVVLDDLMFADPEFLAKMYSVYSHHFRFSVLMTVQNLFHKGLREISLNSQIIILFKNCRDTNQIAHFMQQIYPKTYKNALEAYKNAVSSQTCAAKRAINRDFAQEFFRRTLTIFINESPAKKRTDAAFASKDPDILAKKHSRQGVARVNTLYL